MLDWLWLIPIIPFASFLVLAIIGPRLSRVVIAIIGVGSVGVSAPFLGSASEGQSSLSLAPLVRLVNRGEFDLVAVGRAVLAEPEWARKLQDARLDEIRAYDKSADAVLF